MILLKWRFGMTVGLVVEGNPLLHAPKTHPATHGRPFAKERTFSRACCEAKCLERWFLFVRWATKQTRGPLLSIESWLFDRDPEKWFVVIPTQLGSIIPEKYPKNNLFFIAQVEFFKTCMNSLARFFFDFERRLLCERTGWTFFTSAG